MATSASDLDKSNRSERQGSVFTWTVTILACVYFAWIGASLYYSTSVFKDMFVSMGVELHGLTLIVIAGYRCSYPILFGGAATVVIAKQFFVREKWVSLTITLAAAVVVDVISSGIVRALYSPLVDLMEKVNK
jgi:hypothetical protein